MAVTQRFVVVVRGEVRGTFGSWADVLDPKRVFGELIMLRGARVRTPATHTVWIRID